MIVPERAEPLDAGALIAVERRSATFDRRIKRALTEGVDLVTHGAIISQVWRAGARQAPLARLLRSVAVEALDDTLG